MMLSAKSLPTKALVVLASVSATPAAAIEWEPAPGALTCAQETDIRLISQEIKVDELQEIKLGESSAWTMSVEARFVLKNSSKAKKKPVVMLPVCQETESTAFSGACDMKKISLRIAEDARPVDSSNTVKQGGVMYVRFAMKFAPSMKKEVKVSYRHIENGDGQRRGGESSYATFDYRLDGSAVWQGKVGVTRLRLKAPYKADAFSVRVGTSRGKVERDTAFATWKTAPFEPEANETVSWTLVTPAFRYKTEAIRKKLRQNPDNPRTHMAMSRLLASFDPASEELAQHLALGLKKKLPEQDGEKLKASGTAFADFLLLSNRRRGEGDPCERVACQSRQAIIDIIPHYCGADEKCQLGLNELLDKCCGGEESTASKAPRTVAKEDRLRGLAPGEIAAKEAVLAPKESQSTKSDSQEISEKRAFIVLVSFIAVVWLVAGIMIVLTLRRHHRSKRR